jgi:hypothetical protein
VTAIRNGDCPGGTFATAGAFIDISINATGDTLAQDTDTIIWGSTGGTAGPYTRMQYISITGNDQIDTVYNVPFGYGAREQLVNRNQSGISTDAYGIVLYENASLVGLVAATGPIPFAGISADFPTPMTGGINYEAEITVNY